MSKRRLIVLLIEDSDDDAELIARALAHGGYALELSRVESDEALRGALAKGEYDLAITDHELPGFDSTRVLRIVAELAPDLPCLLVSGKVGEEAVGAAMRQGALDYVAKHRLGSLPGAVERALAWSERRRERHAAEAGAERHTTQQKAITELGEHALREENLDLLMESAVTCVAETLGVEVASILELHAGERAFVVRAEIGIEQIRAGVRVPHGSQAGSQASYTMRQEQPVAVVSYEEETRFDRDPIWVEGGVRSALSVEIPGHQHPFGVLGAAARAPQAFKADDANFLNAVANILANALQRARNEEEMRELALHDSLTGLPSRTLFFDRLALALARTQRLGTRLAVLFLDIDHFKSFNDTLGHRAADRLLTQVGARIERTMRETDTVARFGGDEFVVLCEDLADEQEAEILTTRLVSAFDTPFSFDDERHELSTSIGVALSDEGNRDGEALLRDADIAMYSSKERGRATWTLATEELRVAIIDRVETKSALERAIDSDALLLHYQPIVDLDGGELCGVEALVRWDDPDGGLIQPGQFIPLAEESGLILRLGEWVLRDACGQAAAWRAEFGDRAPLPIHVNFSARQVAQPDLPGLVRDVLDEAGVPPSDIALEITESALIDTQGEPMAALAELKSMGMSIVLDDFGTGYSSLSYLDRFPIDVLKIDQAFVSNLQGPTAPAPIVTAIVGVASALAVGTVAEGVETAEQTAAVAALGCEHAQGFFFARPGSAEQVTRFVHDDTPLRERAAEATALAAAA